ncbi:MAG: acyltransferase family protein [Coriobacteriales bacterium]|nr:acyltransferase family protein [Coriobacteriales bacterium]
MAQGRKRASARKYVNSLDGFRALCALGVIGYHMRLPWCGGGLLGVTILFVLSGYLVTAGLLREFRTSRGRVDLPAFWRRRFWRLMPTVFLFVAVTGAVCAFANHALFTKMRGDILPGIFMIINWTKIFSNESYFAAAGNPSPLTHFWSLAIEAQFYLIWPPVLFLLMRKNVARPRVRIGLLAAAAISALLMALLYVPGGDPSRSYYGTDTRAMSMLLGCWLAVRWPFDRVSSMVASKLEGARKNVVSIIGPLCVVALVAMMLFTEGYSAFSYYGGILLCSVLSVGAIAALVPQGSPMARFFSLKPLVWVGQRSYAIYLWHYPILELLNPLNATTGTPWWKLLLELVLILVISDLSYRFVEQPFRVLGSKKWSSLAEEPEEASLEADASVSDEAAELPEGDESADAPAEDTKKRAGVQGLAASVGGRLATTFSGERRKMAPALGVLVVGVLITAIALVVVEPVTVAGDHPNEKRMMQASLKKPLQDGVYDVVLVGDSVSLGANENLNQKFPHGLMDTKGERQSGEALATLKAYVDEGVVGDDVVWSIGTNGVLDTTTMNDLVSTVGPDRQLWLVNLRTPNAKDVDNNALIAKTVEANQNVHLVDWLGASQGHDNWFEDDGIHLTWDGRDAYVDLLVRTMQYEPPSSANTVYNVVLLGDSVCLDAADALGDAYPRGIVDTADGRRGSAVAEAVKGYADEGHMGNTVILAIANEGPVNKEDLEAAVAAAGGERKVWLVNTRSSATWCETNNDLLDQVAQEHENVQVVDWFGDSSGHDSWFAEDGMHLTEEGVTAFVSELTQKVEIESTQQETTKEDTQSEESDDYDYDSAG